MGAFLSMHRLRRGELARLATALGHTTRALRKWRAAELRPGPVRPAHRPRAALAPRMLRRLVKLWRSLVPGHDGWRTLWTVALREGIALAKKLVQRIVRQLKGQRRAHQRRRDAVLQAHHEVLFPDTLIACDESMLGRVGQGEVRGLVLRDACSGSTPWVSVGPPATGEEIARALEQTALERGGWPLVVAFDNGGANRSQVVAKLLRAHQVVALFNVPHTPRHNPFAERAWGEIKCAALLDKKALRAAEHTPGCSTRAGLLERLVVTRDALEHTPRPRFGGFTPAEIDSLRPRADDRACRARFYDDASAALARVAGEPLKARARRRAEREAILCTLEQHGLLNRTRGGGRSSRPSKRNDSG